MEYLRINQNCQGSLCTSVCTGKKPQKSASSIKAIKQPALPERRTSSIKVCLLLCCYHLFYLNISIERRRASYAAKHILPTLKDCLHKDWYRISKAPQDVWRKLCTYHENYTVIPPASEITQENLGNLP